MQLAAQNHTFAHGFQAGLVKAAINFRIPPQVQFDPRRASEFEALGRTIFNKSYKNPNPFSGLLHTGMAGYGQLRDLHGSRAEFLSKIKALRSLLASANPNAKVSLQTELDSVIKNYHNDFSKRLTEIGAVAEPRRKFLRSTVPAVGVGVGAAGAAGAAVHKLNEARTDNDLANAPLGKRLSYLLNPNMLPNYNAPLNTI